MLGLIIFENQSKNRSLNKSKNKKFAWTKKLSTQPSLIISKKHHLSASDAQCVPPRLKNGRIRTKGRGGRIIRYSCSADYELVGNRYSTCSRGTWDTPTPICVSEYFFFFPICCCLDDNKYCKPSFFSTCLIQLVRRFVCSLYLSRIKIDEAWNFCNVQRRWK